VRAILLIDHGSRRVEANEMLRCVANMVQKLAGPGTIVRPAHMELAEPTIAQGFANCVAAGATEVVAFPYMVSPGRHSIEHIPEMVADAARAHPDITFRVTPAFGVDDKIAQLILDRAGIGSPSGQRPTANGVVPDRCWHPDGIVGSCGPACPQSAVGPQSAVSLQSAIAVAPTAGGTR
jgi:sirohydrochlorin ferrochelatase